MIRRAVAALALVGVVSGCTTFSDAGSVARVDDESLSLDEFEDLLGDSAGTGDAARAVIQAWLDPILAEQQADLDDDAITSIYGAGIEASGFACPYLIVTDDVATAEEAADALASSTAAEVFAEFNIDPGLPVDQSGTCIPISVIDLESGLPEIDALLAITAADPVAVADVTAFDGTELGLVVIHTDFDDLNEADQAAVAVGVSSAAALADVDVWIDSRYGTFDPTRGVVALGG